jgi:Gas vesicle synthesis protein GvpL/GvpF
MMLLYAVIPAEAENPALVGVCGGELETLRDSGVAIVAEECDRPPDGTRPAALRYYEIVDQLSRSVSTLPVRFPTAVSDRDAAVRELVRRAPQWRGRLDELDGLVEMVLRASWPGPAVEPLPEQPSGSAYLRQRAATLRIAEQTTDQLEQTARHVCHDVRRLPATEGVRLACLVPRKAESELRRVIDEWQQAEPGRHANLAGPWPPFSFVEEQEATPV